MYNQIKKEYDDNPLKVVAVLGFAVTAAAKLINAVSASQGRRAYAKQVKHSIKRRK